MAPPPASPCTRTHTRALPVHPLQVDGEWQTEPGTIPFCGALSALPSDAVQAESQVCTRMHTYAHVCTRMHHARAMVSELRSVPRCWPHRTSQY